MSTPTSSRIWDARFRGPVPHDLNYYSKSLLGGALACGLTHAAMTPMDVVKCNMQVNPVKYRGTISGIQTLIKEEGTRGVFKGFGPTLIGYSLQGMFKYGLYEVFKDGYMNVAGEEVSNRYQPLIWAAASASAEIFADIALCPLEMTKVKIQTSPSGTFPVAFLPALRQMSALRAETRYPFGSLVPLWSRQVRLYTVAKFCIFEQTVELFYTHLLTEPKESYSTATQLGVTFGSGYIAGIVSAIVSNPADSLISQLGKAENRGQSVGSIISKVGFTTLATKGLGTRIFMLGTLTGFQWWIYDAFKTSMGMGTTGGK
ncbi:mitochondrial carrier protein [Mycena metata]|uniref:Mitochondrial carrier protein n=1 Tax=Mycena metata TaxID=1033252 RepID=A0AAD7IAV6_9AGAR|nr:mitochondrial carrier protein [Mycena metata]